MTALQQVSLGQDEQGTGGDTGRSGFQKMNVNTGVLANQATLTSAKAVIEVAQALTVADHLGRRVNINLSEAGTVQFFKASDAGADGVVLLRNTGLISASLAAGSGSGDTLAISAIAPGESILFDADGVSAWNVLMRGRESSIDEGVSGDLAVVGKLTTGSASVTGALGVGGNLTAASGTVSGALEAGSLAVDADAAVTGKLTAGTGEVTGALNVDGKLTAANCEVAGALKVSGALTAGSASVTGALEAGSLAVDADAAVTGKLTAGTGEVTGALKVDAKLTAANCEVAGALKVSGALTAGSASVTGALEAGSLAVDADAAVTGKLTAGTGEVTGALKVDAKLTAANCEVAGALKVSGALTAGSASVTGALTAGSGEVTGALNVDGKLTAANCEVAGALKVSGALTADTVTAAGKDAICVAKTSGTQSVTASTLTVMTAWANVSDRVGKNFNLTTGVYTAPRTGFYTITAGVLVLPNVAASYVGQLSWVKTSDNSQVSTAITATGPAGSGTFYFSRMVYLTAGVTYALAFYYTGSTAVVIQANAALTTLSIKEEI